MTTKQLAFKSIPQLAVNDGDTSPNLSAASGVWAWSTILSKPVYWTGNNWVSTYTEPSKNILNLSEAFTININSSGTGQWVICNLTSSINQGTITLPVANTLSDNFELMFSTTQQIKKMQFVLNGALKICGNGLDVLSADDYFRIKFVKSLNTWFKVN